MAQARQGQQHRRQRAVLAGAKPAHDHAEVEERQGQADGERELTRERGGDVAAVDREVAVEQEEHRCHGEQRRAGEGQVGQPAEGVGAERERDHAQDRHELERRPVRELDAAHRHHDRRGDERPPLPAGRADARPHDEAGRHQRDDHRPTAEDPHVERDDQQRRDHHVELVGGEAGVPIRRPPGDPTGRQQVVAEEGGTPDVRPHVAARGHGTRQDVGRVEVREHVQRARDDHQPVDRASREALASLTLDGVLGRRLVVGEQVEDVGSRLVRGGVSVVASALLHEEAALAVSVHLGRHRPTPAHGSRVTRPAGRWPSPG